MIIEPRPNPIPGPPYSDLFGFVRPSDQMPADPVRFINYLAERSLRLTAARALMRADLARIADKDHMSARRGLLKSLLEV